LAKLLINPPNFICLDEPTTHLDIDGVEALTSCFKNYQGTLCFISHDLFFVNQIADHIVEVNDGQLKNYHGNLDYYLEKKVGITAAHASNEAAAKAMAASNMQKAKQKDDLPAHLKEAQEKHKAAMRRLEDIKKETKALEKEQQDLETESYVKSRYLSDTFGRDQQMMKEYGVRLKEIQSRQRDIAVTIDRLQEEKQRISK
jgi:ATP-binding cassette subfamily F protein 3